MILGTCVVMCVVRRVPSHIHRFAKHQKLIGWKKNRKENNQNVNSNEICNLRTFIRFAHVIRIHVSFSLGFRLPTRAFHNLIIIFLLNFCVLYFMPGNHCFIKRKLNQLKRFNYGKIQFFFAGKELHSTIGLNTVEQEERKFSLWQFKPKKVLICKVWMCLWVRIKLHKIYAPHTAHIYIHLNFYCDFTRLCDTRVGH